MTEPVSPHNNPSNALNALNAANASNASNASEGSPHLEKIIDSLETYKTNIVNDYTLKTQDPKSLAKLPNILSNRGKDLKNYFKNNILPPNEDAQFTEVKNSLEPYRKSTTPELLTLVPHYIDHLFVNSPASTLTVEHIKTLKNGAAAYNNEY